MTHQKALIWLKVASASVLGFGIMLSLSFILQFSFVWTPFFNMALLPTGIDQMSSAPDAMLTIAILGGVMTGWGVLLWQLTTKLFPNDPALARTLILWSVETWFVVDSIGSVMVGAPVNVVLNLGFLVLFAIPLWRPVTEQDRATA